MICCVTGHRPKGFPFSREDEKSSLAYSEYLMRLYDEIEQLIGERYSDFVTGMAEGADIDFAKAVLHYRTQETGITLEAALPCPLPSLKSRTIYGEERNSILRMCDQIKIVSPYYHRGCMQKRNRYMVDKSDIVLAIWNGTHCGGTWNTIEYARSKGKPIRYILLNEMGKQLAK